jgi:hypothetical protein
MVPAVAQALKLGTDHRTDATQHTTPGRVTTLRQNDPFCASQRMDAEIPDAAHNGGSARVVLYERRSRAVVIGDAFRSRLEAGLSAWAASMSATAICRPRAPPLGHELPADE